MCYPASAARLRISPCCLRSFCVRQLTISRVSLQRNVVLFGRSVPQPRLICYMADGPHLQYTYSGLTVVPQPWSPAVREVKAAVEELSGCTFNSCLLNHYRTGLDSLGWHSDDEFQVYGPEPTIASVSFGEARDFVIRHQQRKQHKISVNLAPGEQQL